MFQVLFRGKIVSWRKTENNIYAIVVKRNRIMKNVKVTNGEPLNKHQFTLVNNFFHSDDQKYQMDSFLFFSLLKLFKLSSLVFFTGSLNCMLKKLY